MSRHKYIDIICIAAIILSLVITILFIKGESLGLVKLVDVDSDTGEDTVVFTDNDLNSSWDTSSAVQITLEGDKGTVDGDGAYFVDGDLVIASPGQYVIKGTLNDGSIIVDFEQKAKVWILLDGVDITCSDDACLRVNEADKVFLTLAEGSDNKMHSGAEYSEEAIADGTGGVIYSHDDLTINGNGSLTIEADYKHGIESNDDLVITGGTINITCVQDGMHVNDSLKIAEAAITVNAGDDAIHCDTEVYIKSGTILLEKCYEGIEAKTVTIDGGDITIYPSDDGINANGGDNNFGTGGPPNFGDGNFTPPNGDDSNFTPPNGDNDTSAEAQNTAQESTESDASTTSSEEKEENADKEESSQKNDDKAATDSDEEDDVFPTITINGGNITVINETGMDADGLDSNGDIIINGGTVFVSMPGGGMNNGLDYGSENDGQCLINGGTVIACGGSGMLEEVSEDSGQCSMLYVLDEAAAAGSVVSVLNSSGETILSKEIPLTFSSLILSSPELEQGQTYTLNISSDETDDITADLTFENKVLSINTSESTSPGGMPQMGQMPNPEDMKEGGPPQMGDFQPGETGQKDSDSQDDSTGQKDGDSQEDNTGQKDSDSQDDSTGQKNSDSQDDSTGQKDSDSQDDSTGQKDGDSQEDSTGQKDNAGQKDSDGQEVEESTDSTQSTIREYDKQTWVCLGVCVLVLLAGVIFVKKY